jgi:tetratricopeptide (TPR) repeat protein
LAQGELHLRSLTVKSGSIVLICGLGLIVYSNSFDCSFHFDDQLYIVNNFAIRSVHNLLDHWRFYPCRFITFLSLVLNYHFSKLHVFGYHLFNQAVHLACSVMVWWLTLLTLSTPAMKNEKISRHGSLMALMAGLVFVSHPVQTEAVTYIWQRAASMSAMFYLASLCFYIQSRLAENLKTGKLFYVVSLLLAVAAMFTKENAVTLPLIVLLYEAFFFDIAETPRWKISLFLSTIIIIPLTMALTRAEQFQAVQRFVHGGGTTPWQYLMTQLRVLVTYIRLLLLPVNQNLDYDYPIYKSLFEGPVLAGCILSAGLLWTAARLFSKYRLMSFSIFWFFLTLSLESGVLPLKNVIFEHRLYLPMAGYSLFLAGGAYYLWGRNSIKAMVIGLGVIVAFNSTLTYQRNEVWKNELTLWGDAVRKSPRKARPYNNRGFAYNQLGKPDLALDDYNKAIVLDPKMADAYVGRGLIYAKGNDFSRAIADYSKAIDIDPGNAQAYQNRGIFYYYHRDYPQAISDLSKAIHIDPYYAQAYYNRGLSNTKQGNLLQAIFDYNRAVELDPDYADAYYNRGLIFARNRYYNEAIYVFNKAIALDPHYADAYNNLGIIYADEGRFPQAIFNFNKAIQINPQNAESYSNRGNVFALQGRLIQAVADYGMAVGIDPRDAQAYNNRAVAYFRLKKYDRAWDDVQRAEESGGTIDPQFLNVLKTVSGREK